MVKMTDCVTSMELINYKERNQRIEVVRRSTFPWMWWATTYLVLRALISSFWSTNPISVSCTLQIPMYWVATLGLVYWYFLKMNCGCFDFLYSCMSYVLCYAARTAREHSHTCSTKKVYPPKHRETKTWNREKKSNKVRLNYYLGT